MVRVVFSCIVQRFSPSTRDALSIDDMYGLQFSSCLVGGLGFIILHEDEILEVFLDILSLLNTYLSSDCMHEKSMVDL